MRKPLTHANIRGASPGDILWDETVKGLHLRATASRRSFFLYYRTRSGIERRPKLGEWPTVNLDSARAAAKKMWDEILIGNDPSGRWEQDRASPTVKEMTVRYMEKHGNFKKQPENDQLIIDKHILPRLGTTKVKEVQHNDIEDIHAKLKATPYMANRTLALLSKMFNLMEKWGYRPLNSNPCRHVRRYTEEKRRRYLKPEEAINIAAALEFYAKDFPDSVAFIYLLLLTGARKSEIATARWDWIDGNRLELPDSKTGARTIFLPPQVMEILDKLPRTGKTILNIRYPNKCWAKVLKRAGISDLRIHDLRHSFASAALSAGLSLSQIGELLGHKSTQTTKRYAHLADGMAHQAAELTAARLVSMMAPKPEPDILN